MNNSGIDGATLADLIQKVRATAQDLPSDEAEIISDSLETIEAEALSAHPKKGLLRTAITGIKAIKGSVEFVADVTTLVQFLGNILEI